MKFRIGQLVYYLGSTNWDGKRFKYYGVIFDIKNHPTRGKEIYATWSDKKELAIKMYKANDWFGPWRPPGEVHFENCRYGVI
jgi:hypothetical protein